ncbi:MAG: dihydroorotase, partial [Saprospiraceae bacterium]|nr:dihydroorotase [Saprospiraceae bacterium]
MTILIKNAKIIFPKSSLHNKQKDVLIKNGLIEKIGRNIKDDKAKVIKSKNLHCSIGWLDVGTICGEPGYEHRETFESLSKAASSGGYTGLCIFPNTHPPIDNKSSIQYILNSTKHLLTDYYPIGAVSKACKGKEITEMIDLSKNGAIAFSDGHNTIDSNGLFLRALEYLKSINGLLIHQPNDPNLSNDNNIHEGIVSTSLGLKASPSLSEFLTMERDVQLAKYADSKLLVHQISTKESIEKLKATKIKNIFSSVAYHNLCKTEKEIELFDVNSKVSPPLRSEEDKEALINAVSKGVIDIITSNHVPLEEELKKKEFVYADGGAIGLQTCFGALMTFAPKISLSKIVNA